MIQLVLVVALLVAGPLLADRPDDQPKAGANWEATGLAGSVLELFAPRSGAFFARVEDGLLRSDDAGGTWTPVPLPPAPARRGPRWAAVDPNDHTVLYVEGAGGLYRTRDDAATWGLLLPAPTPDASIQAIAVSPADPSVVYVFFLSSNTLYFLRTADGGASWERDELPPLNSPCVSSVALLQAHPTDAARVFRAAGCYAGRNFGDGLWESADGGATWTQTFRVQGTIPRRLVGGEGRTPNRFYLGAGGAVPNAPSVVARSDDDARTWREVRRYESTPEQGVALSGLAYDPDAPDRLWVGLGSLGRGVQASTDGGSTWSDLGLADRAIHDLVLGIDRRYLFAATNDGLWRLSLLP